MVELSLVEVRLSPPQQTPVVVLREANGPRHLAIWMSATAAAAIMAALEEPAGEITGPHELLCTALQELGHQVRAVEITGEQDGRFFAEIQVDEERLEARPSDAIAVALRWGVAITCADGVLERVGVATEPEGEAARPEDEVERFRAFLDTVNPDDF